MTHLEGVFVIKLLQEFMSFVNNWLTFCLVLLQAVHKYNDVPGG